MGFWSWFLKSSLKHLLEFKLLNAFKIDWFRKNFAYTCNGWYCACGKIARTLSIWWWNKLQWDKFIKMGRKGYIPQKVNTIGKEITYVFEYLHNSFFCSQRVIQEKENIKNSNESLYYQCLNWCIYFLGENILTTMLFYCVKSCMIRSMQKTSYFGLIFTILKHSGLEAKERCHFKENGHIY